MLNLVATFFLFCARRGNLKLQFSFTVNIHSVFAVISVDGEFFHKYSYVCDSNEL